MSVKKILSPVASKIKLLIIILIFTINSKAEENNIKYYSDDMGILSLMYHRFNENKYPSTNIQMNVFKEHIKIIKELKYDFYTPVEFTKNFSIPKKNKKILITIDDAYLSFYENACLFLKQIKYHLFYLFLLKLLENLAI